jgi:hypothetical protein
VHAFHVKQLIYRGYYVTINKPPAGSSNQIALKTPIGEFPMDVTMHTVEQPDGRYDVIYMRGGERGVVSYSEKGKSMLLTWSYTSFYLYCLSNVVVSCSILTDT